MEELRRIVSIPILSIVEETAKEVRKRKVKKVGLLATKTTIKNKLYENELDKFGIETIVPDKKSQNRVVKIIKNVIAGKKLKKDKIKLRQIIRKLKSKGAEGIILGCTELPLLIDDSDSDVELFDSTKILAEATVKKSFEDGEKCRD